MFLGIDDIVPEALHRKVGWDMRHHFMAEKIVDRFGLPKDERILRYRKVSNADLIMTCVPKVWREYDATIPARPPNHCTSGC